MKVPGKPMSDEIALGSSFRDPSGFLFVRKGILYRQVNKGYQGDYDFLISSGLYKKLVDKKLLIAHKEVNETAQIPSLAYKVIQPEKVNYISYPFEWCFSQLKDAALEMLKIQKIALGFGMSLKDASAYNIQFHEGKATLIDTLSFEHYEEGKPWVAYKQFCQHFLGPLALMAKKDIRLGLLSRIFIDGLPLDLTSRLLPYKTRLNFGLATHIHLHSKAQKRYAVRNENISQQVNKISKTSLIGLIENLENTIVKIEWLPGGTEWNDYYEATNYTDDAFIHKKKIVNGWLDKVKPQSVWDLGANNGLFTRFASEKNIPSIAFDIDPGAVEQNYNVMKENQEQHILPLVLDLTNPSPAIGWHNRERGSLIDRGPTDMIFALALIHHLAISNNVPMMKLADFFSAIGHWLVIEFVPKSDSQVQKLIMNRKDIFDTYNTIFFEDKFEERFIIHDKVRIQDSERDLYLMERKKK